MPVRQPPLPPFSAPYAPDDRAIAVRLLAAAQLDATREARIDHTATRLIEAIRARVATTRSTLHTLR
jgi:RHH-type proline utilization regulon transcriptional repressor/proline dehydrogenase/delta 1-pyrroline-5-carboxylate dehydrogenase